MKVARFLFTAIFCSVIWQMADAQAPPSATASIRGTAMFGGEPFPGLGVTLHRHLPSRAVVPVIRTETDADGKFQFNHLVAGRYYIEPHSPHLIPIKGEAYSITSRVIEVADGETRDNINLELQRGGVITGKVTDAEGNSVIGQSVWYERVDQEDKEIRGPRVSFSQIKTDDRGIYRLFGLLAGRYRVYIGERGFKRVRRSVNRSDVPLTYHPGAQDVGRANVVEVTAGDVIYGIDIKLSADDRTYQVVGRVIDAQTGAPLPRIPVGYGTDHLTTAGELWTDERGEFRYDGFPPGSYSFFAHPNLSIDSEYYSDKTIVEIADKDVEGVVVKAHRGASLSGWVSFEGSPGPVVMAQISELRISPSLQSRDALYGPTGNGRRISPDGRLTFFGLRPGKYWFTVDWGSISQGLNLLRIEHRGVVQEGGIEVLPGKNLTDVRFILSAGIGGIRGRIQTNNEKLELPENAFWRVMVRPTRNQDHLQGADARANQRGNFIVEGLAPGEYEVRVELNYDVPPPRRNISIAANRQVFVVKPNLNTEVVIPIEIINQGQR